MKSSLGGVEGWCNYEHNKVFCYPFCLFFLPKQGRKQDLGGYKKINRGSVGLGVHPYNKMDKVAEYSCIYMYIGLS